ncbi:MAG: ABC transporter ATP-binding protein [Candidatus Promineifilaceae bacterium]
MIELSNLTKQFDNHVAVDRLTLTIEKGEVFGFLGPNGAGKTTTVRMLTSLIRPTSGRASVLGYELGQDDQAIRSSVGILTEMPGLYDRLSAWRNLMIYAKLYEVEDPDHQVEKYLKWLGLWSRRGDSAGTFSKGMRQKLAIARSLIHEPEVLFLDEPTAGLDPESAKLIRDFIEELREAGRTIFICTHNLDEADRLCDRIAVFNKQLRVVDSPDGLRKQIYGRKIVFHFSHPGHDYVNILEESSHVKEVEAVENKIVVSMEEPEIYNPEIISALVSAGAQIQFVGEIRHSLEDIYLQLVD